MRPISDEELLSRQFRYEDPESIPGLCRDRPDQNLDPEIVGFYEVRPFGGRAANPDAPYVWCCHCQKPTHWGGRVLKDKTDSTYIIGADCGRKHYGDKFVVIDRAFNDQLARQKLLVRWSDAHAIRDQLLAEIKQVFSDPTWAEIEKKRAELKRVAPDVVYRLKALANRAGSLIVRDQVRDLAAEEQRRQSHDRAVAVFKALSKWEQRERRRDGLAPADLDETPILKDREQNLGPLRGLGLFLEDRDVRAEAIKLRDAMGPIGTISKLGAVRNAEITRTLRRITDAATALRSAFVETAASWRFFEPDHTEAVERWYAGSRHSTIAIDPLSTVYRAGALARIVPLPPRPTYFDPPALKTLLADGQTA
ncbi:hypothetical protein ACFSC3_19280 [Sphingomonas floccifaciens]|uniref:Uncharacterized protein n=1 Tax=Sphingomonas floccifaciens TaxID=1844115 RepID=A0ABW4NHW3_9SPHN